MASRGIALSRIIEWAKTADTEELHFVTMRFTQIAQERQAKLNAPVAHDKVKRPRKAKIETAQQAAGVRALDTHDLSVGA